MRFLVETTVFSRVPQLRLVVGWLRFRGEPDYERIDAWFDKAWAEAGQLASVHLPDHPRIAPWRAVFRGLGLKAKDYLPSVEALSRRARKGGPPLRIHPLVDAYNAVSLENMVPVGAFDLEHVHGDICLRFTRGGETYVPMGAEARETAAAGELAYVDDEGILTRHFVWRQADRGKIRPETHHVFVVSELLAEARELEVSVTKGIAQIASCFAAEAQVDVVDEQRPMSTFDRRGF